MGPPMPGFQTPAPTTTSSTTTSQSPPVPQPATPATPTSQFPSLEAPIEGEGEGEGENLSDANISVVDLDSFAHTSQSSTPVTTTPLLADGQDDVVTNSTQAPPTPASSVQAPAPTPQDSTIFGGADLHVEDEGANGAIRALGISMPLFVAC